MWSAFVLGILGSTHCALMCAPISLALPGQKTLNRFLISRLIYNVGRVFTYALLGFIFGSIKFLLIYEYQEILSIGIGLMMILLSASFISRTFEKQLTKIISPIITILKRKISESSSLGGLPFSVLTGLLNGLLPCGLVYIALLSAVSFGNHSESMYYMLCFGFGTMPLMFTISMIGYSTKSKLTSGLYKLTPAFIFLIGLALIVRGLHLDIPYVSPALTLIYPELPSPAICE